MADLGGYTNIPDTLPEAQKLIVQLSDSIKRDAAGSRRTRATLNLAVTMIENGRKALNAVAAPEPAERTLGGPWMDYMKEQK